MARRRDAPGRILAVLGGSLVVVSPTPLRKICASQIGANETPGMGENVLKKMKPPS